MSAFEKKRNKSKLTVSSTNTTTTNTQSTNATSLDISTTSEEDPPSTASSSYYRFNLDNCDEDLANFGATANIVNRYKMERKNSQSHAGKMVSLQTNCNLSNIRLRKRSFQLLSSNSRDETESRVNIPSTQSYSNAIQTLINSSNVRVKIADLGNACYDVSEVVHQLSKSLKPLTEPFPLLVPPFYRRHSNAPVSIHRSITRCSIQLYG